MIASAIGVGTGAGGAAVVVVVVVGSAATVGIGGGGGPAGFDVIVVVPVPVGKTVGKTDSAAWGGLNVVRMRSSRCCSRIFVRCLSCVNHSSCRGGGSSRCTYHASSRQS